MLSATNTITDIKLTLINDYSYYGYSDDASFVSVLTRVVAEVKLLELVPYISSGYYDAIAAKDKVSLTEIEEYIYWAEIYYSCSNFLESLDTSSESSSGDSIKVEGYEYSDSSSVNSWSKSASKYNKKAIRFMGMAGYNVLQIKRSGGLFYDDRQNDSSSFV